MSNEPRDELIESLHKRRARLIEKYADEIIKPLLREADAVCVKVSYEDIEDAIRVATYIADSIIKATEEE